MAVLCALAALLWSGLSCAPEGVSRKFVKVFENLLPVDRVVVSAVDSAARPRRFAVRVVDGPIVPKSDVRLIGRVREILERHGAKAAPALLTVLRRRYATVAESGSGAWGRPIPTAPGLDGENLPLFVLLRDRATPELDALALSLIERREENWIFRAGLAIVLCREGNGDAVPRLLRVAENPCEECELRKAVLYRLSLIGPKYVLPYRDRLRGLLWEVVGRVDLAAAACLGQVGDAFAVSLLRDGLRRELHIGPFLAAVERLVEGDIAYDEVRVQDPSDPYRRAVAAKAEGLLTAWLEASKDRPDSEFEETRRQRLAMIRLQGEYVGGTGGGAEPGSGPVCGGLSASDTGFAERALRLDFREDPESIMFYLERVRRLGEYLEKKCEGAESDAERIERITRYVLRERIAAKHSENEESFFWFVLDHGAGNCLGIASLFAALGESMGKPMGSLVLSGHAVIRIHVDNEDRYYEPTAGGELITRDAMRAVYKCDAWPEEWWQGSTSDRLVAAIASNRAAMYLKRRNRAEALRSAEAAIAADGAWYGGYFCRARVMGAMALEEGDLDQAERDYATCLELCPACGECRERLERLRLSRGARRVSVHRG